MKIAVVGAGYVGLVTAVCLADRGHEVVVAEQNDERRNTIASGKAPFFEPLLDELLIETMKSKKLSLVPDIAQAVSGAELSFIAVGTPFNGESIDLSQVSKAASEIGKALKGSPHYHVVAVKSTVVPGTTDTLVREAVERQSRLTLGEFGLCMNPEFLREGSAIEDFRNPDRIVIGSADERSASVLHNLYSGFGCPILHTNLRNAELTKYCSNSLLALLVSFSNELATLCEKFPDIDIDVVMDGAHLDRRLSPVIDGKLIRPQILSYLRAGCGFGGSCLPKDVMALRRFAQSQGVDTPVLDAVMTVNNERAEQLMQMLEMVLGDLRTREVAVLGLSFKPNTDDVRESPALRLISTLLSKGCRVRSYDPMVSASSLPQEFSRVVPAESAYAASENADALIIATAWEEFASLDWERLTANMHKAIILDGRRLLAKKQLPPRVVYLPIGSNHSKVR
ncbi:MAG TPA: UDP-glucose/GDP-mannose dehydrogenase family protein [Oculatellaceae cyanobacterium]